MTNYILRTLLSYFNIENLSNKVNLEKAIFAMQFEWSNNAPKILQIFFRIILCFGFTNSDLKIQLVNCSLFFNSLPLPSPLPNFGVKILTLIVLYSPFL